MPEVTEIVTLKTCHVEFTEIVMLKSQKDFPSETIFWDLKFLGGGRTEGTELGNMPLT